MARVRLRLLVCVACLAAVGVGACRSAPNLPVGERTCLGFPVDVCRQQVEELELEGAAHGGVAAYRIVCTSGACTTASGEGTVAVVFADGSGREGGFGYAQPVAGPPEETMVPLPVVPSCVGVPEGWCLEHARSGADIVSDWSTIDSIAVRCAGICTATEGNGETVVRLIDGETVLGGWSYDGEAPPAP